MPDIDTRANAILAGSLVVRSLATVHDAVARAWPGSRTLALVAGRDRDVRFWSIVAATAALVALIGSGLGAIL